MRTVTGREWAFGATLLTLSLGGCVVPVDVDLGDDHHLHQIHGNGHVVAEFRAVEGYHTIVASGASTVIVTRDGYEGVEVQAEENLLRFLETRVWDGVLHLGIRDGASLSPSREILFYVDAVELGEIQVSGAVHAELDLGWQPDLYVVLSGATSLEARGETDALELSASGASRFGGLGLEAAWVHVGTSGAAGAYVWATERLDARASGASFIRYTGYPEIHATTSGAATIRSY